MTSIVDFVEEVNSKLIVKKEIFTTPKEGSVPIQNPNPTRNQFTLEGDSLVRFMRFLLTLKRLNPEFFFNTCQNGEQAIHVSLIDRTKSALLLYTCSKFAEFHVSKPFKIPLSILNNYSLLTAIKDAKMTKNVIPTMTIILDELKDSIIVKYKPDSTNKKFRTSTFPTIDPEGIIEKDLDPDKLLLQFKFEVDAFEFRDVINRFKSFGFDTILFSKSENQDELVLRATNMQGATHEEIFKDVKLLSGEGAIEAQYAIHYLVMFLSKKEFYFLEKEKVIIRLGYDLDENTKLTSANPLVIEHKKDDTVLKFILSPVGEEEESDDDLDDVDGNADIDDNDDNSNREVTP